MICSPDSSINTTEILLKVASCIRLVFDYIYLLFVPLTLQIMAAEYTSACDTNHLQLFPRSWILWEVVISKCLFLGCVLLFIVFIQIVLLLKDCLIHVCSAFDVLTAFFYYISCKVQQLEITLLWQWRYKCYFSNSSVPLTFVKISFSSEWSEFSDLSIIAIRI